MVCVGGWGALFWGGKGFCDPVSFPNRLKIGQLIPAFIRSTDLDLTRFDPKISEKAGANPLAFKPRPLFHSLQVPTPRQPVRTVIVKNLLSASFLSLVVGALLSLPNDHWAHMLGVAAGLFLGPILISVITGGLYRLFKCQLSRAQFCCVYWVSWALLVASNWMTL